jgi:peptidoglycan hydrolase-like protein with peptidoglycan-binding domain
MTARRSPSRKLPSRAAVRLSAGLTAAAALLLLPAGLAGASPASVATMSGAVPDTSYPTCGGTSLVHPAPDPSVQIRVPTTADGTGNANCILEEGDEGVPVARLQIGLDDCHAPGVSQVTVDSDFGPLTKAAVEATQRYWGIRVDGIAGPQTISTMEWPIKGLPGPPYACDPLK